MRARRRIATHIGEADAAAGARAPADRAEFADRAVIDEKSLAAPGVAAGSASTTVTSFLRSGWSSPFKSAARPMKSASLSSFTEYSRPASNGVSSGPSSAPQARRPASMRSASSA